ncbi:protein patched homolog 2-like isoform X2 [Thrips palmi]|nr:protein patched homolog 2-like isoform X2 [Thrips palmi]
MMTDETFDPSILLGTTLYCSIVKNMELGCLQQNLLDLWRFSETKMRNLTKAKMISDLNSTIFSPTLGHPISYKSLLGGITYDENGVIISAKALMTLYAVHVNFSTVNMDEVGNQGGTADWANGPGLEWESYFLKIMHKVAANSTGMEIFYEAGRSFGDISASGMFQDMDKIFIGVILMLVYIQVQQTNRSWVETRMIPSMVGLLCVGLAFVSSCGLCSLVGIPYGPVHTSLPFLLLGIGVDDMFVILNCWNSLPNQDKILPIPQRMGVAMRHAGLSISITSVTDFVAFLIGSTTILPSLRSFCLYAGVGVLITFILQSTLFVAALALDQTRLEAGRNCVIPCVRHTPPKLHDVEYFSQCSYGLNFIYSNVIMTKFGKIFVILVTVVFVSASVIGNLRIKQEFKPEWFLDNESHLYKFLEKRNEFFPDFGNSAGIYMGQLHYNEELKKIGLLVEQLKNHSDILMNVEDWWSGFQRYVKFHFRKDIESEVLSDSDFNQYISQYLFSPSGARFQKNFRFSEPLECGKPASNITVASIDFFFRKFESSEQSVPAMNAVKFLVVNANFTSGDRFATVWAKVFANWVTDEVIAFELVRNIVLAILAVAVTTFILLGSIYASALVLSCVILTLVNTIGYMYFWGLTIDLVSSIALVLAVGLCVDFAAHIAYAFMGVKGPRNERAMFAVSYIGGAVLHGGATTLLALSVLVFSNSYIFTAFFKVFLLVIVLGLFHGIVFLPVVLSVIGPKPYPNAKQLQCNIVNDQALEPVNEGLSFIS